MAEFTLGFTRLLGHGRAFSEVLPLPNPAAANGFTYTNDGRYWELLDVLSFRLVTDSNAANRQVKVTVQDGSGVALLTLPAASVQTASLTWDYTFAPDLNSFNTVVGLTVTSPLPYVFLQPMFKVVVSVGAVQVGDQISNIRAYAQRFVTGPQGYRLGYVDEPTVREDRLVRLSELVA